MILNINTVVGIHRSKTLSLYSRISTTETGRTLLSPYEVVFEAVQREVVLLRAKIRLIKEKLEEFERKYGMKTSEFIEKFNSGELGDKEDFFLWWSMHRALEKIEARLRIAETYLETIHSRRSAETRQLSS